MKDRDKINVLNYIVLSFGMLLAAGTSPSVADSPVVITNVVVHTEPGSVMTSASILMENGRISDVGSDLEIPLFALKVDGTGLHAYPGFIDASNHIGIPKEGRTTDQRLRTEDENPDVTQQPLPATRLANRRGIRPQYRALELYAPDKKEIQAHRSAGFTAALIVPRHGILSGTSDVFSLGVAPIRQSVIRSNVAMHASFRTGEDGVYPRSLLGVIAQYRQVLLDAGWHARMQRYAQRHPTTTRRPPVDAVLDALQPLLGRSQRLIFEANSENEIRRALDLAAEFDLDVALSGAKEAWKVIDRIKSQRVPLIVSIKFDEEPEYGRKSSAKKAGRAPKKSDEKESASGKKKGAGDPNKKEAKKIYEPLKVRKERRRQWEEQVANCVKLHQAGIAFSLRASDFEKPSEFWKNLRKVMERGLPEDAAIAALTTAPAELFGLGEQMGRIRKGQFANLALFTKPISDKETKARYVFVDGVKFELDKARKEHAPKGPTGRRGRDRGNTNEDPETTEEDAMKRVAEAPQAEAGDKPEDRGPTFASEIDADRVPATRTNGNVLITNATIIPVTSATMQNASILIRKGQIESIGSIENVPDDVTVIDARGKFVLPGLVDCHSHLGVDGVNEGSLSVTAEVRIADLINPHSTGIFRAVAGGTTTHHVMHGSANPIGGQNAILKLKYGRSAKEMLMADAPGTIKFALGENVIQSNRQSAWGKRFPNTRMGVEAVIRQALEEAKLYIQKWQIYRDRTAAGEDVAPPRRDLRLEALAKVLTGDLAVHSHCYRSEEILRLLATAEDYGFRIGTLQHVLEGYRIAPEIARHGAGASTFSNFWAYKLEAFGAIAENAALMTDHGINVSVNSDSANTIRYLAQEAAKSIRWGGLDENQALRMVTINPAQQLLIDDRVGSLEVGKDGDIAIFNGHPLNTFSKCVMTLIEGEVYFEDARPEATEPADTVTLPRPVDAAIPETPHQAFAITGATVHPISGDPMENATVVIVDDKIHAVGTAVTIPPGAGVIDASGLHVYPGLIDAGTSVGLTEIGSLRATRDSRDIATFAPELRAASAFHPHSVHIRIGRSAGTTTALTAPGGGRISGQSAVVHLDGWTTDEMLVVDNFGLHMNVPSKPVRERPRRFGRRGGGNRPTVDDQIKELEDFLEKASHYAKVARLAADDPTVPFERDLKLEAMIPYLEGRAPVVFSVSGYKQMLDTIEFAQKHNLRPILSGATQSWKIADQLAEKNIPVIFSNPLSYPRGEFEPWDSIYRCAGDLARAGVKFCFASSSASGVYNLGTQAGMAVAHGLPKQEAEYALTLGAAEILGIDDRVGSIEVGKQADLIVTTDSPLQTASVVTHMFIDGRPIELTSLHTESYEKFKNRPAPNLPPIGELKGPPSLTAER